VARDRSPKVQAVPPWRASSSSFKGRALPDRESVRIERRSYPPGRARPRPAIKQSEYLLQLREEAEGPPVLRPARDASFRTYYEEGQQAGAAHHG